jgi:hypothetical protein
VPRVIPLSSELTCYMQSFAFGRPPSLAPAYIDCPLPTFDFVTNKDGKKEISCRLSYILHSIYPLTSLSMRSQSVPGRYSGRNCSTTSWRLPSAPSLWRTPQLWTSTKRSAHSLSRSISDRHATLPLQNRTSPPTSICNDGGYWPRKKPVSCYPPLFLFWARQLTDSAP